MLNNNINNVGLIGENIANRMTNKYISYMRENIISDEDYEFIKEKDVSEWIDEELFESGIEIVSDSNNLDDDVIYLNKKQYENIHYSIKDSVVNNVIDSLTDKGYDVCSELFEINGEYINVPENSYAISKRNHLNIGELGFNS